MTESIFVPFRLTTKESIEKAVKVLTSEPTPWPKSEENYTVEYLGEKELRALGERLKSKRQ